jgi:hypothetical protein
MRIFYYLVFAAFSNGAAAAAVVSVSFLQQQTLESRRPALHTCTQTGRRVFFSSRAAFPISDTLAKLHNAAATCAIPYEERNVYAKLRALLAATAAPFVQWLLLLLHGVPPREI